MAAHGTEIEWTKHPGFRGETWNPVTGCDRVSPGCANCYALELAPRLRAMGLQKYIDANDGGRASGPAFGVTLHRDVLDQPLRWTKPRCVFVNSMSDVFHDEVPDSFIASMYAVMAAAPRHRFLVLTKRVERAHALLNSSGFWEQADDAYADIAGEGAIERPWPLPNVWLGVTIENRAFVHRADVLRATPAAVRFISAEPLLGPLVAPHHIYVGDDDPLDPAPGTVLPFWADQTQPGGPDELDLDGIDWLITGGESGGKHRRFDPRWAADLRDACLLDGVAFFHKQNGGRTPKAGGRELDGRTWDEIPAVATERA